MKIIKAVQLLRLPYPDYHLPQMPIPLCLLWTNDVVVDEWGMEYALNGYYAKEAAIDWAVAVLRAGMN